MRDKLKALAKKYLWIVALGIFLFDATVALTKRDIVNWTFDFFSGVITISVLYIFFRLNDQKGPPNA